MKKIVSFEIETSRRLTEQLADILWGWLDQQTDKHLLKIIEECRSRTKTNCGWVAYGIKDVTLAVAKNLLQLRSEAADQLAEDIQAHKNDQLRGLQ